MKVLGAVLAGGASSRFGSDKAAAVWRGRTLLEHARATLADVVDEVVVIGRGSVLDLPRAGLGPLGGIAGALDYAAKHGFASVVTMACDMPEVPRELLGSLLAMTPAYCDDTPVLGHWPVALAHQLIERLAPVSPSPRPCAGVHGSANAPAVDCAEPWMPGQARHDGTDEPRPAGALSVRGWAIAIGAVAIPSPAPLANINTLADLAAL